MVSGQRVRNPTVPFRDQWTTAGLNCEGFRAGPPTTVSSKLSAPIVRLADTKVDIFLGVLSYASDKAEVLKRWSPLNSISDFNAVSLISVRCEKVRIAIKAPIS